MADEIARDDDALKGPQDAKLYPVGEALRATYNADNHATLSKDVTGLMLDLSRVPFEPHEFEAIARRQAARQIEVAVAAAAGRPGWFARLLAWRRTRAIRPAPEPRG